jgi:hypothetical protein
MLATGIFLIMRSLLDLIPKVKKWREDKKNL